MRKVTLAHERWPIAGSFTISRGSKTHADVITVALEEDGHVGRGECVPYGRYNETVEATLSALEAARPAIEAGLTRAEVAAHVAPLSGRNALDWRGRWRRRDDGSSTVIGLSACRHGLAVLIA